MLKKHILAQYAKTYDLSNLSGKYASNTLITKTIEVSDQDEIQCLGDSTIETRAVENTDDDEIKLDSTKQTFTLEESDQDALYAQNSTVETSVIENSDVDEFYS